MSNPGQSSQQILDKLLSDARSSNQSKKKDQIESQENLVLLSQNSSLSKPGKSLQSILNAHLPKATTSQIDHLPPDRFGKLPHKHLSRKAWLATQPKTAGRNWFELPAAPTNPSHKLKTEIAALKLASAIDPKRFLKGEAKKGLGKMPDHFHIGHIIQTDRPTSVSMDVDQRGSAQKTKKRSFVDELAQSQDTQAYTKRKYAEVQDQAASGGRGHYKKRFGSKFASKGGGRKRP